MQKAHCLELCALAQACRASPVFTQLVQDSVMESSMPSIMMLPANIIMAVSEVEVVLSVHPLYMPQWMALTPSVRRHSSHSLTDSLTHSDASVEAMITPNLRIINIDEFDRL